MKEGKVSRSPRFDELLSEAKKARANAYAPYSRYAVGAALLGSDGRVYAGCNMENASYGATICAERGALAAMIASGCRQWSLCVVVTDDGGTPCGVCRQAMHEFATADAEVVSLDESGNAQTFKMTELLPHAFRLRREP